MDKPKKSWYKRWWAIAIYVFVGLIIMSAMFGNKDKSTSQITDIQEQEKTDIQPSKQDLEQAYIDELLLINSKSAKTLNNVVSTSTKASQGQISISQASELYYIYESQFKNYLKEVNALEVPDKYSASHKRVVNAYTLYVESMNLMARGTKNNDDDLMLQSVEKMQEANTEISTATEIMKTLS